MKQAVAGHQTFANLTCMLADYYFLEGDLENALKMYEQALKNAPTQSRARAANGAAYVLAELERGLDRAVQLASGALLERPDDPSILDTLGWAYYRSGQYNKAVVNLARAIELSDTAPATTLYHLALAYRGAGMVSNARETAEKLVAADASWADKQEIKDILAQQ